MAKLVTKTINTLDDLKRLILSLPVEQRVVTSGKGTRTILLLIGVRGEVVSVQQGNMFVGNGQYQTVYTVSTDSRDNNTFYYSSFKDSYEPMKHHEQNNPFPVRLVSIQ